MAPDVLDRYVEAGLLRKEFYERAHICPNCDSSSILFREVCPDCGSAGLEQQELLHHFTCAGVFPTEAFGSPDELQCPKCRLSLRSIGVDHEYLDGPFVCARCEAESSVVATAGRCMTCDHRFPADEANSHDWYQYELCGNVSECGDIDTAMTAFARVVEGRDRHRRMHSRRMEAYCGRLALALMEDRHQERDVDLTPEWCRDVARASVLHDVGNAAIARDLLLKPGVYTPDERASAATHVRHGGVWLEEITRQWGSTAVLGLARNIVRSHHERWDGSGYGEGRVGESIPLEARIVAVADLYDSMRRARSYRPALSHKAAVERLADGSGHTVDPAIVAAFTRRADEFARLHNELS